MKYILKTTYPCLAVTETENCELDENDMLEIEDEERIFIYPENSMPFSIDLRAPKENAFYSLFVQDDHTLILLEGISRLHTSEREKLNFAGNICEIEVSDKTISFLTNSKRIEYLCPHSCQRPKIFKLKNFACVQFENDFYAYSMKDNRLSHYNGQFSLAGDKLSTTKAFHDSDNRERSAVYRFGEEITMENEEFVRDEKPFAPDLVPFKLLESVKAKDFVHALDFLSENLKKQVNQATISEFFGNFSAFLPLSTTEFITIGKNKNYVKFSMQENKIDDISVDNL